MEIGIPKRLSTLGHPQRLAVFRLLMRRYPDHVPATEIAHALAIKPNTLSAYVNALMQAGLVTQERRGTSLRYAVDMETARETLDYLLLDCCRGRPELCRPQHGGDRTAVDRKSHVLFICTGNSTRSIFAEAILRREAGDRFAAFSAGTKPRTEINSHARALLAHKGHDIAGLKPKELAAFQSDDAPEFDFVITVCNHAANEDNPALTGQPVSAHWGIPSPRSQNGADGDKAQAVEHAYDALQSRIRTFAALPIETLDRIALQRAVDRIATQQGMIL